MLFVYLILVVVLIIILKFYEPQIYLKEILNSLLFALSLSLILELTVFNFRHYESYFFKEPTTLNNYNYYDITCDGTWCKTTSDQSYIEITNINQKINNLYLDIVGKKSLFMDYDISFNDEANQMLIYGGTRKYVQDVKNSHYLKLNTSGKSSTLKIKFNKVNTSFQIKEIAINVKTPMFISNIRLFLSCLIILFIKIIKPKNNLFKVKYNNPHTKFVTASLIMGLSILFVVLSLLNSQTYVTKMTSNLAQYQNLAYALNHHQFNLNLNVSDKLLKLNNPYDTKYRDNLLKRHVDYYWDYAYYQGKYYSYFGIVPCLLTYLPYYTLTHHNLPNAAAISIGMLFLICSVFYFLYQLIDRYFKKTPYMWYALLSIFFIISSGYTIFAGEPTFYNLPIIFGISFALLSIAFYLKATNNNLNKKYLFLGSLSLALVAGCRPQLLVCGFIDLIILSDYLKNHELFSKKSLKTTLILILPIVLFAIFIMYYNYTRFGSIFDFGANYNLTTNDMTKRGFRLDRIFLGLYYFLFAPTRIIPVFPFIMKDKLVTSYLGKTIFEDMHGGFYFLSAISILGLLIHLFKNQINNEKLLKIGTVANIMGILIVILDTELAGILPRYITDFAWLLNLSTIIVILSIIKKCDIKIEKTLVVFITLCLIINGFSFFLGRHLFENFPILKVIYAQIYYSFMFWL